MRAGRLTPPPRRSARGRRSCSCGQTFQRSGSVVKGPLLAGAHVATRCSRSPPVCSGPPSGEDADERRQWCSSACHVIADVSALGPAGVPRCAPTGGGTVALPCGVRAARQPSAARQVGAGHPWLGAELPQGGGAAPGHAQAYRAPLPAVPRRHAAQLPQARAMPAAPCRPRTVAVPCRLAPCRLSLGAAMARAVHVQCAPRPQMHILCAVRTAATLPNLCKARRPTAHAADVAAAAGERRSRAAFARIARRGARVRGGAARSALRRACCGAAPLQPPGTRDPSARGARR